jgi:DNA-binding transcriptional LysR family regulator
MELRHLRYFVAVAEALSFSRAAASLRLAQPSLSTQIQDLENDLGLQLLERNRNRVALTDVGTIFLKEAKQVLARAEKAVARAHEAAAGRAGELRIGSMGPLTISFLPACLHRLHVSLPRARVSVQEMGPPDQISQIDLGRLHVGFVPAQFTTLSARKRLTTQPILRSPLAILISEHHPLAEKGIVKLRDLEKETFLHIYMFGSDAQRFWTQEICEQKGFSPRFGVGATNADNLVTLVAAGEGVALIPRFAERPDAPGCIGLKLADKGLKYELLAVYNERFPSGLRDTLLKIVEDEAGKLEKKLAEAEKRTA